jgi:hypothetical protein
MRRAAAVLVLGLLAAGCGGEGGLTDTEHRWCDSHRNEVLEVLLENEELSGFAALLATTGEILGEGWMEEEDWADLQEEMPSEFEEACRAAYEDS